MTNLFLRAKHWQLFVLMFGIPLVVHIIFMISIFSRIQNQNAPDNEFINGIIPMIPVIMVLPLAVLFGWKWSIVFGLRKKIPQEFRLKTSKFKIFFSVPILYMILLSFFILYMFSNPTVDPLIFAIIVPLHLFSMFCIFYCIYFVAKTIKIVELQRTVTFNDFVGEFFMIWFIFIGIWILQPRINKLYYSKKEISLSDIDLE